MSRDAIIFPYKHKDDSAAVFAKSKNAILAGKRDYKIPSLSPLSFQLLPSNACVVLPSPNGSTLTLESKSPSILAGSIVNATAVAKSAQSIGKTIGIIAAGERWEDGSLRPSIEDFLGAGAIISKLSGKKSSEAYIAEMAFKASLPILLDALNNSVSGKELIEWGFEEDVKLSAELDLISNCVPLLMDGAYRSKKV